MYLDSFKSIIFRRYDYMNREMSKTSAPIPIPGSQFTPEYRKNVFDPFKPSPPNSWNTRLHARLSELYGSSPVTNQFFNKKGQTT